MAAKKKAKKKAAPKFGKKKGVAKKKAPGRDFRGFKKSTGQYDAGPGPIGSVMGVGGAGC